MTPDTLLHIASFFVLVAVGSAAYVAVISARNNERTTEAYHALLEAKYQELDSELKKLPFKINEAIDDAVAAASVPLRDARADDWENVEPLRPRDEEYQEWKYQKS